MGQTGTATTYTGQFPNAAGIPITRTWVVYVPLVVKSPASALYCFHGTLTNKTESPLQACTVGQAWAKQADARGNIVVAPIASYSAKCACYFWEGFGAEKDFPAGTAPADSAFVASLMAIIDAEFGVGVNQFGRPLNFVTGFSDGGMFTNRYAAENSLLIAAACPMSGTLWVGTASTVTQPQAPTPICFWHGDADTTLPYAGGKFPGGWGNGTQVVPSVDVEVNYWLAANSLPPNPTPLVTNGAPTPGVYSLREWNGTVEVRFLREIGYLHTETQFLTIGGIAEFFAEYGL
jgi:poly(3-hydroxybutyrate) depolymerase